MCTDSDLNTPLHMAAYNGRKDIVTFLAREMHCDPMSQNIRGNTVLHVAIGGGHLQIVKFLIEKLKCPPDIAGPLDVTPLQMAVRMHHPKIAQYLQKHSVILTYILL